MGKTEFNFSLTVILSKGQGKFCPNLISMIKLFYAVQFGVIGKVET